MRSWGILSHSSRRAASSSWRVCWSGSRPAARLSRLSQTCFIGLYLKNSLAIRSYASILEEKVIYQIRTLWPAVEV